MKKYNSTTWCNVGIAAGFIAIFFGISLFFGETFFYEPSYAKFGADFYTEQYAATRAAAMNIATIGEVMNQAFAAVLTSFGIADIAYFFAKKAEIANSNRIEELLEKLQPSDIKEKEEIEEALKF